MGDTNAKEFINFIKILRKLCVRSCGAVNEFECREMNNDKKKNPSIFNA